MPTIFLTIPERLAVDHVLQTGFDGLESIAPNGAFGTLSILGGAHPEDLEGRGYLRLAKADGGSESTLFFDRLEAAGFVAEILGICQRLGDRASRGDNSRSKALRAVAAQVQHHPAVQHA